MPRPHANISCRTRQTNHVRNLRSRQTSEERAQQNGLVKNQIANSCANLSQQ